MDRETLINMRTEIQMKISALQDKMIELSYTIAKLSNDEDEIEKKLNE